MNDKKTAQSLARVLEDVADSLQFGFKQKRNKIGITVLGSELGTEEIIAGAGLAQNKYSDIEVVLIGSKPREGFETVVDTNDEKEAHRLMDEMLASGAIDATVTMHYSFPLGVSTVGRVITPAKGKEMYIATTTGVSDTDRVAAMVKNALYGIATAKACGNSTPTVGILNVEGARQVERILLQMRDKGYPLALASSERADEGVVMRGNDLITGAPDVMVTDSLSGNILMKLFSAYTTGGKYEALGYGYGPGVGEDYTKIICILSRASGAPVVAGAINFASECVHGQLISKIKSEFAAARKAGWPACVEEHKGASASKEQKAKVTAPEKKIVTEEIAGIEIMDIEDAVESLWEKEIYAESGMGCTGPIVLVAGEDRDKAEQILKEGNYI